MATFGIELLKITVNHRLVRYQMMINYELIKLTLFSKRILVYFNCW